jgi:hypothetical protein
MESNNHLYTKSYFIKRLIDKKFYVTKVVDKYPKYDSRYWTILVNPGRNNFLITCIRSKDLQKTQFRIYAKNDVNLLIETESMEVIISTLLNLSQEQSVPPIIIEQ